MGLDTVFDITVSPGGDFDPPSFGTFVSQGSSIIDIARYETLGPNQYRVYFSSVPSPLIVDSSNVELKRSAFDQSHAEVFKLIPSSDVISYFSPVVRIRLDTGDPVYPPREGYRVFQGTDFHYVVDVVKISDFIYDLELDPALPAIDPTDFIILYRETLDGLIVGDDFGGEWVGSDVEEVPPTVISRRPGPYYLNESSDQMRIVIDNAVGYTRSLITHGGLSVGTNSLVDVVSAINIAFNSPIGLDPPSSPVLLASSINGRLSIAGVNSGFNFSLELAPLSQREAYLSLGLDRGFFRGSGGPREWLGETEAPNRQNEWKGSEIPALLPRRPVTVAPDVETINTVEFPLITDNDLPFSRVKTLFGDEALASDLKHLLTVIPGERLMRPTYGSRIETLLFDLLDDAFDTLANEYVQESVGTWERRVRLTRVTITKNPDQGRVSLTVYARLASTRRAVEIPLQVSLVG